MGLEDRLLKQGSRGAIKSTKKSAGKGGFGFSMSVSGKGRSDDVEFDEDNIISPLGNIQPYDGSEDVQFDED